MNGWAWSERLRREWQQRFDRLDEYLQRLQLSREETNDDGRQTQTGDFGPEIVTTRLLDAPRDLVWRAFTEPEHLIQWWGPDGFTNTFHEIDIRPGGVWRFVMHGPDGTDYDNYVRFIDVVPPERLVYDHGTSAEDVWFRATVTLEAQEAGTLVTLASVFSTAAARDLAIEQYGAIEGARQTLGRLAEHVKSMRETRQ